jgi:hypothetical protein
MKKIKKTTPLPTIMTPWATELKSMAGMFPNTLMMLLTLPGPG